jgi:tRNA(Met) C34 N-acetyltransferase TmcA
MKINKQLEKKIVEWHSKTFLKATLESQIDKLKEEIEEVKNSSNMREFYTELADTYISCIALQRWSGYAMELAYFIIRELEKSVNWEIPQESFEKMIADKLEINKSRTWAKNELGVYHHIKGESND